MRWIVVSGRRLIRSDCFDTDSRWCRGAGRYRRGQTLGTSCQEKGGPRRPAHGTSLLIAHDVVDRTDGAATDLLEAGCGLGEGVPPDPPARRRVCARLPHHFWEGHIPYNCGQMADEEQLRILRQGARKWNAWRMENPAIQGDLRRANLNGTRVSGANLSMADLDGARLSGADLSGASLPGAGLSGNEPLMGDFSNANLEGADLSDANFAEADSPGRTSHGRNYLEPTFLRRTSSERTSPMRTSATRTSTRRAFSGRTWPGLVSPVRISIGRP